MIGAGSAFFQGADIGSGGGGGVTAVQAESGVGLLATSTPLFPVIVFGSKQGGSENPLLRDTDLNLGGHQFRIIDTGTTWSLLYDFSGATNNVMYLNTNNVNNTLVQYGNSNAATTASIAIQLLNSGGNGMIRLSSPNYVTSGTNAYGPSFMTFSNGHGPIVLNSRIDGIYIASESHDLSNTGVQRAFLGGIVSGTPFRNIFLGASSNALPVPDDGLLMQVNGGDQSITGGSLFVNLNFNDTSVGSQLRYNNLQVVDTVNGSIFGIKYGQVNVALADMGTPFSNFDVNGSIATANPLTGLIDTKWQLGGVVPGTAVVDAANYVQVSINGVSVKLAIIL